MKLTKIQLFLLNYFLINGFIFFLFNDFNLNITSIFIGSIISILIINLYFVIKNRINKDINLVKIIYIPLLIFLFIIIFKHILSFISYNYLIDYPILITILSIILILIFIIKENNITLYKTVEICFYICFILYIISLFSLIKYVDIQNIIINIRMNNTLIIDSIKYSIISLIPMFLMLNLEDLKLIKESKEIIIRSYIISNISIIIKYILIVGILSKSLISIYKYPFISILKNISFYDFLDHLEKIFGFEYLFYGFICIFTIGFSIKNIIILIKEKTIKK